MSSDSEENSFSVLPLKSPRKRGEVPKNTQSKRVRKKLVSDGSSTFFDLVFEGKIASSTLVDDWIDTYQKSCNEGLLELIQFFINASGCKGTVTAEMLEEATDGFQDIIKKMTEEFDEDSGDYPLVASGLQYKRFKSSLVDFIETLIKHCQYEIVFDEYLMDNFIGFLTELSTSQVRAFRHTVTFSSMKLMTSLVTVFKQLNNNTNNFQKQFDAENKKSSPNRALEKLDILKNKLQELETQMERILSMLDMIYKGIFVNRYRDVIPNIRALCLEELGHWIKILPEVFFTDSYLKYIGWSLHDKIKEVRLKCLQSLLNLFDSDEDILNKLRIFLYRFKTRLVSLVNDKEPEIASIAVKILTNVSKAEYQLLTDEDTDKVFRLVYASNRSVASAAATFLNNELFLNKDHTPVYTKSGKRRSSNAPLLADLVFFFIESELHEHATYLVDSLWDVASGILKDFECMSDMLLEEPYDNDKMDDKQETALVDIMVSAVKQAAEGVPPSGRHRKSTTKEKRQAIEDKVTLTEHFIIQLPKLLNKFQVDEAKVENLLQIARCFDLEFYTTGRFEKYLDDLLEELRLIMEKHTSEKVLLQVSRTLKYLSNVEYSISSTVLHKKNILVDSWVEKFLVNFGIFQEAGEEADTEEIYNVVHPLKKIVILYSFNDLSSLDLYKHMVKILTLYNENPDFMPEVILRLAYKFLYHDFIYGLLCLKRQTQDPNLTQENKISVSEFRVRLRDYFINCKTILASCSLESVRIECYLSVCDMLVYFSPQLAHSYPTLKSLVLKASDQLVVDLLDFVRDYVFVVEEEKVDEATSFDSSHFRRSYLAAICKLFVYNMINLTYASFIFQHYIRFYTDYGDIIKETISRSRHHNKLRCAQTLALSLMTLFRETVREQGGVLDHSSQEYVHMKELARRFALTFGLDQVKTRDAVAELHKEGILFALKREDGEEDSETIVPPNLSFLGILVEFSAKLMRQDKKTVVQYLDKHIKSSMLSDQDQDWIPLVTYRNSLLQGVSNDDVMKAPAPPKGRRGRKKKGPTDNDTSVQATRPMTPQTHRPMTPQRSEQTNPQSPRFSPQQLFQEEDFLNQPYQISQQVIGQPKLQSTVTRSGQDRTAFYPHNETIDELEHLRPKKAQKTPIKTPVKRKKRSSEKSGTPRKIRSNLNDRFESSKKREQPSRITKKSIRYNMSSDSDFEDEDISDGSHEKVVRSEDLIEEFEDSGSRREDVDEFSEDSGSEKRKSDQIEDYENIVSDLIDNIQVDKSNKKDEGEKDEDKKDKESSENPFKKILDQVYSDSQSNSLFGGNSESFQQSPGSGYQLPVQSPGSGYQLPAQSPGSGYQLPVQSPGSGYQLPVQSPGSGYQLPVQSPGSGYQLPVQSPGSGYQLPVQSPGSGYQLPVQSPGSGYQLPVQSPGYQQVVSPYSVTSSQSARDIESPLLGTDDPFLSFTANIQKTPRPSQYYGR